MTSDDRDDILRHLADLLASGTDIPEAVLEVVETMPDDPLAGIPLEYRDSVIAGLLAALTKALVTGARDMVRVARDEPNPDPKRILHLEVTDGVLTARLVDPDVARRERLEYVRSGRPDTFRSAPNGNVFAGRTIKEDDR